MTPSVAPTRATPTVDPLASGARVNLAGAATVTVKQGSSRSAHETGSVQLVLAPGGAKGTLTAALHGAGGDIVSLSGPVSVGTTSTLHVALLLRSLGAFVDTDQGVPCTTRVADVSETAFDATVSCRAVISNKPATIRAVLRAR